MALVGPYISQIKVVKRSLHQAFTNIGLIKYCLDLEITYSTTGMFITQHKYIEDLLTDIGIE